MRRCKGCGHHHGITEHEWPSCKAIEEQEDGGVHRCGCTGLHGAPPPTYGHQELAMAS